GWYFRVLTEGSVQRGMQIRLAERKQEHWTIAAANHVMHHDQCDRDAAHELANVVGLSPNWHATLMRRAETGEQPNEEKRLGIDRW
ncbi:MAG: 3-alpha domain-containing protein, partial [Rubripirellula sp.]